MNRNQRRPNFLQSSIIITILEEKFNIYKKKKLTNLNKMLIVMFGSNLLRLKNPPSTFLTIYMYKRYLKGKITAINLEAGKSLQLK